VSPAELIAREVRKIVAAELAVVLGRRLPLYERVISFAEKPLIDQVLQLHHRNQSRAALALGINRNTLRKKILDYGIT